MCPVQVRPVWLERLDANAEREAWPKVFNIVDEVAARILHDRHDLPWSDISYERADTIKDALGDGRIKFEDLVVWRDEMAAPMDAVARINEFRRKDEILEAYDPVLAGNIDEAVKEILRRIWTKRLAVSDWTDFIDTQKEFVPRHLFLYRIPAPADADSLLLAARHIANPAKAELAEVSRDGQTVRMRWVAMRGQNRRVAFARIDLDSGALELQLEQMDGGGMPALVAERNLYARTVGESLGVTLEPVHLEVPMRALMSDPRLRLESWRVRLPGGGENSGKRQADLFARLRDALDVFYALEVKGKWQSVGGRVLAVQLDARTDAIHIREQCTLQDAAVLVSSVREHAAAAPPPPIVIPKVADEIEVVPDAPPVVSPAATPDVPPVVAPEVEPQAAKQPVLTDEQLKLIEKFMEYQNRLGEKAVPIANLPADLLFDYETLEKALRSLGVRFLAATLYVMCPVTATRVKQNGQVIAFESLSDIPEFIECHNEEGEPKQHRTKGNIWIEVIAPHEPEPVQVETTPLPPPPPPVPVSTDPGPGKVLLWFLVYMLVNTVFHLWLRVQFSSPWAFIGFAYAITTIGPVVLIRWKFGRDAFKDGTELLLRAAKEKFGPKDEEESP